MHRIRMSTHYFKQFGWDYEIVAVDERHCLTVKEEHLNQTLPADVVVHHTQALNIGLTKYIGLGSLALRSLLSFRKTVNVLLKHNKFDLIYFSTTQFPVLILGGYWKKKFNIPYVFDIQDPWYSTYYDDKPKSQRPKKHWFSSRLNKVLERIAMRNVDGIISVSESYIHTLKKRYPRLNGVPTDVITFASFKGDTDFVKNHTGLFRLPYKKEAATINLVYAGRGGHDLQDALLILFRAFKQGLANNYETFSRFRFHFLGTSYAASQGVPTIYPIAEEMELAEYVKEQTDRIPFYQSIYAQISADALLIIGSNDPQYTASKIYPYIMAERPLIAFFHSKSSAAKIVADTQAGEVVMLDRPEVDGIEQTYHYLAQLAAGTLKKTSPDWKEFERYSAANMTSRQCELFNRVINKELIHVDIHP